MPLVGMILIFGMFRVGPVLQGLVGGREGLEERGGERVHATEVNKEGKAGKVELTVRDKGAHVFGFCACKHAAGAGIPTYELHGAVVTGSDHPATDSGAGKGAMCR